MAENTAMPLWLDIKKEYIDENLDGVLNYLHKRVKNTALQDSFYQTTVNLRRTSPRMKILHLSAACAQCTFWSFQRTASSEGMPIR